MKRTLETRIQDLCQCNNNNNNYDDDEDHLELVQPRRAKQARLTHDDRSPSSAAADVTLVNLKLMDLPNELLKVIATNVPFNLLFG